MVNPITTAEMQKIKDVIKALESDDTIMKLHGHDDFAHTVNPRFVLRLIETIEEQQKVIGFYASVNNWDERWREMGGDEDSNGDVSDVITDDDIDWKLDDSGEVISCYGGKMARDWMGRVR